MHKTSRLILMILSRLSNLYLIGYIFKYEKMILGRFWIRGDLRSFSLVQFLRCLCEFTDAINFILTKIYAEIYQYKIYISPIAVEAILWGPRAVSSILVLLVTYVKYLNPHLTFNIWKNTEIEKEREELGWGKDFKLESRDMKLCLEFQVFMCRRVGIFKNYFQKFSMFPNDQKTQSNICFKTNSQEFETLSQISGWDFQVVRGNQKLSPVSE